MVSGYLLAVSAVVSSIVGLVVVLNNVRSAVNVLYGLLTLLIVIFCVANHLSLDTSGDQLYFVRIVMVVSTIAVGVAFLFVLVMINGVRVVQRGISSTTILVVLSTAVVAFIDTTPLLFSGIARVGSPPQPAAEIGMLFYITHLIIVLLLIASMLAKALRSADIRLKNQLKIVLTGIIPTLIFAPITGIILPQVFGQNDYIILAPLYALFFVTCVGYAILKHGLLDVKLAVVRSVVYGMLVIALAFIYYFMAFAVSMIFLRGVDIDETVGPVGIILALVLAFIFQPIKRFFDQLTDSIFYRDMYKTDEFFARISELLGSTTDLRGLLERTSVEIATTLKAEQAFFFLYYTNVTRRHLSAGTAHHNKLPVYDAHDLDAYVMSSEEGIIVTDLLPETSNVRRMLVSHKIALVMPLKYSGTLLGYVLLGEQQRSGGYNKRDLKVLSTITDSLVIGVQNALSIHAVKEVNLHLQQRIDVATKELRSSNSQLRHLDEVKDEFMSMASHQLRTPLTSIKGYLSMVLEEDMGKITSQQRTVLSEAFNSSERMVRLIADFLNVSRLQTGKFIIEKSPVNIVNVVRSEVNSLQMIATTHDMKLVFTTKEKDITLPIDEAKVRQVVMNFIDNAIYYSPAKSTISVLLETIDDQVAFKVVDSGIGVPASQQPLLFNKFFRAKNARQQRPDGTGVGLYLAKKVIVAHGGKMIFSSVEGKGSTFGFRLPLPDPDLQAGSKANHLKNKHHNDT